MTVDEAVGEAIRLFLSGELTESRMKELISIEDSQDGSKDPMVILLRMICSQGLISEISDDGYIYQNFVKRLGALRNMCDDSSAYQGDSASYLHHSSAQTNDSNIDLLRELYIASTNCGIHLDITLSAILRCKLIDILFISVLLILVTPGAKEQIIGGGLMASFVISLIPHYHSLSEGQKRLVKCLARFAIDEDCSDKKELVILAQFVEE